MVKSSGLLESISAFSRCNAFGLDNNWPTVSDVLLRRYFKRSARLTAAVATLAFVSLFSVNNANGAVLAGVTVVCATLSAVAGE